MKKLYAGLAAAALTATGIACTAGTAHADAPGWPDQFQADQIVTTASGATFLLGDYDTGQVQDYGDGESYPVTGTVLVKVVGTAVTTIDLGTDAAPTAIAAHGDTVYAVGTDGEDGTDAELWTLTAAGAVTDTHALATTGAPQEVAVSSDGNRLAVAGWDTIVVLDGDLTPTATMPTSQYDDETETSTGLNGFGGLAFSPNGETLEIAANDYDGAVDLWSLGSDAGTVTFADVTSQAVEAADGNSYASGIAVAADGTAYVTTINGDSGLYAVKGAGSPAFQPLSFAQGLALSADGSTAYVAGNSGIFAVATGKLGTYGDNPTPDYFAGGDESVNAVALNADGDVLIAESRYDYDEETETGSVSNQTVDVVTAPGAPSHVTATRGATYAEVSFDPATSTGSSAWTSTDPDDDDTSITYTITLTDTTNPSAAPIVRDNTWATSDLSVGDEDGAQLVPGDAYLVSVTTTNGLFTSSAATYALPAYQAPNTGDNGNQPISQQPTPTQPAQVTKVKAAPIKSTSKKLTLSLPGVTSAPGKVKVYDGKKLIGKAKIKDGKVVIKLKKKLGKGKHKVSLKYAGSTAVAKFTKTVKVKVK